MAKIEGILIYASQPSYDCSVNIHEHTLAHMHTNELQIRVSVELRGWCSIPAPSTGHYLYKRPE